MGKWRTHEDIARQRAERELRRQQRAGERLASKMTGTPAGLGPAQRDGWCPGRWHRLTLFELEQLNAYGDYPVEGVYAFFVGRKLKYIGESADMLRRIAIHLSDTDQGFERTRGIKLGPSTVIALRPDRWRYERKSVEHRLQSRLSPPGNRKVDPCTPPGSLRRLYAARFMRYVGSVRPNRTTVCLGRWHRLTRVQFLELFSSAALKSSRRVRYGRRKTKEAPVIDGLYAFFVGGVLQYIGESYDILARIVAHLAGEGAISKRIGLADAREVVIAIGPDAWAYERLSVEHRLLSRLRPPANGNISPCIEPGDTHLTSHYERRDLQKRLAPVALAEPAAPNPRLAEALGWAKKRKGRRPPKTKSRGRQRPDQARD